VVGRTIDIRLPTFGWVLALGLIVVGGVGLVGALRGGSREPVASQPEKPAEWNPSDDDDLS
jgi:hypothetical protein